MKSIVKNIKLGIAPIGWTNDDMPDLGGENTFEQCVSEMALAGFTGSEVGNKYPSDPAVLNDALGLRGLTIAAQWFSAFLTTEPFEAVEEAFRKRLAFLAATGASSINVSEQGGGIQGQADTPLFRAKPVFSDREWELLTSGLNRLGAVANGFGIKLSYHHHMGTGVQTAAEVDRLMAETDPGRVYLLFDTGHFALSGDDPLTVLIKHGARVGHVHLKDIRQDIARRVRAEDWSFLRAVREGVFTVPGDGAVGFPAIFAELGRIGYEGWMIVEAEQDPARANPLKYALMARAYIREHTGI